MSLLRWSTGRAQDAEALRNFQCTERGKKKKWPDGSWQLVHPAKWELSVQSAIRQRLKPLPERGRTNLLGWDGDILAGVTSYSETVLGGFSFDVLALEIRYRRRGGGWADEALTTALDFMTADAVSRGLSTMTVGAVIHERNRPAQSLARSFNFEQTEQQAEGFQVWSAEFPLDSDLDLE